jgi:hypothetical protein
MPTAATEVRHVAFTHHRIGIHAPGEARAPRAGAAPGELRAWRENPRLSELDKQRGLGLAYLGLARVESAPSAAATYRERGRTLLSAVRAADLPDPAVEAALARVHFEAGRPLARSLAELALSRPGIAAPDRCTALFVLGVERMQARQFQDARASLQELVTLRRYSYDWLLLSECETALGNRSAAASAVQTAARIDPRLKIRP